MDMILVMAGLIPSVLGLSLPALVHAISHVVSFIMNDYDDDDEDEDEELSYWPDTSGWFIIITFFIIGAWQSWGDLIYYTFWSFIGYWIGVGLFAGVVDWIVDKLKEE